MTTRIRWITGLFLICSILAWYRWLAVQNHPRAACLQCNVILIIVDTLRAQSLPCYGYAVQTAPNICKFASDNVLFTHAYANANWTLPSNMSVMTSLYPTSHGMDEPIPTTLHPKIITLAQRLSNAGYDTSFIAEDDPNISTLSGITRGFSHVTLTPRTATGSTIHTWKQTIDAIAAANAVHKPVFAYFHTADIHDYALQVFVPPKSFPLDPAYHTDGIPVPTVFTEDIRQRAIRYITKGIQRSTSKTEIDTLDTQRSGLQNAGSLTLAAQRFAAAPLKFQNSIYRLQAESDYRTKYFNMESVMRTHLYDDAIRSFDNKFGDIISYLTSKHLSDSTVVILLSDHGEYLGEHHLIGHTVGLSDEVIHIPLIMHIPGVISRISDGIAQHIDILPTVLDIVGISIPNDIAGISLYRSMVHDTGAHSNAYAISETTVPSTITGIRTHTWEYTNSGDTGETLYRTENPAENVLQSHPDVTRLLTHLINTELQKQPTYTPVPLTLH